MKAFGEHQILGGVEDALFGGGRGGWGHKISSLSLDRSSSSVNKFFFA
jgi:hypothetical protein